MFPNINPAPTGDDAIVEISTLLVLVRVICWVVVEGMSRLTRVRLIENCGAQHAIEVVLRCNTRPNILISRTVRKPTVRQC